MPGYNLQTLRDEAAFLVTARHKAASNAAFPDAQIFRYLQEAFRIIQKKLKLADRSVSATLTAGLDTYLAPSSFGRNLAISVRNSDNSASLPLALRDYEWLRTNYDLSNTTDGRGDPQFYAYLPTGARRIIMRPVPAVTIASGLQYIYRLMPEQGSRIYNQTTITANIAYGSTSLILSASPATGRILDGDEIGIVETTQSDGAAVSGNSPARWYTVFDASANPILLTEAYEGPTVTAANFIAAPVPAIEAEYPGQMGMAPAMLAASMYLKAANPPEAEKLEAAALAIIGEADRDNAQLQQDTDVNGFDEFPNMQMRTSTW